MHILLWLVLSVVLSGVAPAQPARVLNARQETRSGAAGLDAAVRSILANQIEAAWIGYAVPAVSGDHQICCGTSSDSQGNCGTCRLEERPAGVGQPVPDSKTVRLEAAAEVVVLVRISQRQVEKIRVFSPDCELDFGGLRLFWLIDVKPKESLQWLSSLARSVGGEAREARRRAEAAITALAHHAGLDADQILEEFTAGSHPLELRKQSAFWLGTIRGAKGFEILKRLVRQDADERFRAHVVFALSQSREPESVPAMITTAREDKSSHVRGQALFWLAQKAGRQAAAAISAAVEQDPETQVKKKAVFALHQLPKDEGIPLLIQIARNSKNSLVRKEAMFWLGQSHDPRALAFFEEVLTK